MTEISVVPPPMSQIMWPAGSTIGMPAPIAAAKDSGITLTDRAPALNAESMTAFSSTLVIHEGTPITILGFTNQLKVQPSG